MFDLLALAAALDIANIAGTPALVVPSPSFPVSARFRIANFSTRFVCWKVDFLFGKWAFGAFD